MQLTIHVPGAVADARILATTFDVVTTSGALVAQGAASPAEPATVVLPDDLGRVYVLAHSPSGKKTQQAVDLASEHDVSLELAASPHEWLAWVAPFRSLTHLSSETGGPQPQPRHIGAIWMVLWQLRGGQWSAQPLPCADSHQDTGARQITIDMAPDAPGLLQVGGDALAWRLISLPGGPVRVAVTRSRSDDPGLDSVKVTVARVKPMNELIMSYLSRGAMAEADRLGKLWESADLDLYAKQQDSVSAAAGAYLLLKIDRLEPRRQWVENLVSWFPMLPDGPIIAAALALEREPVDEVRIRQLIGLAVRRGLPVFSMGLTTLLETATAIHRGAHETEELKAICELLKSYNEANAARGAFFAFYGQSPWQPSRRRYTGPPDQPTEVQTTAQLQEGTLAMVERSLQEPSLRFVDAAVAGGKPASISLEQQFADMRRSNAFFVFGGTGLAATG